MKGAKLAQPALPAWRPSIERYRGERLAAARIEYLRVRLDALDDEVRFLRDVLAEQRLDPWALFADASLQLAALRKRLREDPGFRLGLGCGDELDDEELDRWELNAEVSARMLRDVAAERGQVCAALDEALRRHRGGLPPVALPRLATPDD